VVALLARLVGVRVGVRHVVVAVVVLVVGVLVILGGVRVRVRQVAVRVLVLVHPEL
jgi:hypothetical protein